jgi:hypothetical protein
VEPRADAPPPADDPYRCARCGAPHDPYQEYCLECGARLARPYAPALAWRRELWSRDSPFWFFATFLALLAIALVAGAIVLAATGSDDDQRPRRQAARPTTSVLVVPGDGVTTTPLPETITAPGNGATVPTLPTTGTTTTTRDGTTTRETTTSRTTTTGGSGTVIAWPAGRRGHTVILASIPTSEGRSRAEARAREAISAGLSEVGVLDSSDFSSLNAGYHVVFAGIHDTEAQAKAAVPDARQAGYAIAYPRRIVP